MDLPVALSFFLGKDRAKDLIEKRKKDPSFASIRSILIDHINKQIQKLRIANLTFDGWKGIINEYDTADTFSQFSVYDLRMKAFYLENLFIKALECYDTIHNFETIAELSVVQTNKSLNVYGTERANLHIISHHHTLLKWF